MRSPIAAASDERRSDLGSFPLWRAPSGGVARHPGRSPPLPHSTADLSVGLLNKVVQARVDTMLKRIAIEKSIWVSSRSSYIQM